MWSIETEEGWRIRNSDELEKLMRGEDVVKYITAQRIKRWGHLNRMEETKTVRKIKEWNPIGKSSKERPENRWKDELLNGLQTLKVKNSHISLKTERPGVTWCRRPKYTKGCSVCSRRRRTY